MEFFKYLNDNKEWIFSGVGIITLGWIFSLMYRMFLKKEKSGSSFIQKSGDKSVNIQGVNVNYNNKKEEHKNDV